MLNAPSFIHLLLEKLFAELKLLSAEPNGHRTSDVSHRTFYVSAWISQLISCNSSRCVAHSETKVQRRARLKGRVFVNRIQMRWQQLLALCLEAACASTPHLLRLILEDMEHPLPLDTRQNLLRLCSIYTQMGHGRHPPAPHQQVYTLESLHEKMQRPRWRPAAQSRDSASQEASGAPRHLAERLLGSPWQVCSDDVVWRNFPLGRVPRQSSEPSCLMVESFSSMTVFDQLVEVESRAARSAAPPPPARPADALLWTSGDLIRLKCGLRLF